METSNKQTAMEWLEQEFISLQNYGINELGLFAKAKEMEKQQMIEAIDYCRERYIDSENYYNQKYGK